MKSALAIVACVTATACAPPHVANVTNVTDIVLHTVEGSPLPLADALRQHSFTVVTFFSADCPCQRAHDPRLRTLVADMAPLDVGVLVVDSEESASSARDALESRERGYAIVLDDAGKLARSLDAEYATYSVVLNRAGKIIYRGGFDSDRSHLRDDRSAYLANALEDAIAGRPLRHPDAKALGCTLQLR